MRIVVYPHAMSIGGSQLNAIELAAAVRDLGHEVTIFAAESGQMRETVERLGLPLVLAPKHGRRPSTIIAAALRDLCQRDRVDIVHGYEWPPCLEAFYGPLLFDGVVVGCTVLSMSVASFIPSTVRLVVGTEQIAAATRTQRSSAVSVIEPPIDTKRDDPNLDGGAFRSQYQLENWPVVTLVSRLGAALKLEGIERAIGAAALLAESTGLRLVIVGDGPARERVARAADDVNAQTGQPTVTLTGELGDPRSAYAAADVVLGMGSSALRGMAFAKPLVVLGELGFAKLLTPESAGLFLWQGFYGLGDADRRPELLAQILGPLLEDRRRQKVLGAFSRRLVESRFSLCNAALRQVDLYRDWLLRRPRRRDVWREAASTAFSLFSHKVRQRLRRSRGKEAAEDFNAISEIKKTAALAGSPKL